jgi:hypothetical protein
MQKLVAAVVALITLSAVALTAQRKSDPWVGTWKTDLAKSTFSPGPTPTVAATVTIEPSGSGMKTTIVGADAEGKPVKTETVWTFDGKDNPVKGAPAANTTAAYKRIDDRTFEVASKIDGKPAVTTRVAISADGKTMTATQSGTDPKGQSVKNVIVATKQ